MTHYKQVELTTVVGRGRRWTFREPLVVAVRQMGDYDQELVGVVQFEAYREDLYLRGIRPTEEKALVAFGEDFARQWDECALSDNEEGWREAKRWREVKRKLLAMVATVEVLPWGGEAGV
jgi:hypothetical protein